MATDYNTLLGDLREVRDELKPLLRQVEKLNGKREKLIEQAADCEKATAQRIATSAGLSIGDIVERAPALAPQTQHAVQQPSAAAPAPTTQTPAHQPPTPEGPERTPEAEATAPAAALVEDADPNPAPEAEPAAAPTETETEPAPAPSAPVSEARLPHIPDGAGTAWITPTTDADTGTPLVSAPLPFVQRPRAMAWLDATTGELVYRGERHRIDLGDHSAAALVTALHATLPAQIERVYITAGEPWHRDLHRHPYMSDAVAAWLNAPMPEGWKTAAGGAPGDRDRMAGHFVHERRPVGRWQLGDRREHRYLEIRSVAEWFDPAGADPATCRDAFGLMWKELRLHWEPLKRKDRKDKEETKNLPPTQGQDGGDEKIEQVVLMGSPSQTGLYLWSRTVPGKFSTGKWAGGFPVQSEEVRQLLHATSGQGRIQLFTPPRIPGQLDALVEADRTFAYAKHTWTGAVGTPERISAAQWAAMGEDQRKKLLYRPGHWMVRATVPAGWKAPGLLPLASADGSTWEYPDQPGRTFTTWAQTPEVALARSEKWKWQVEILDGLSWADGAPLKTWGDRLKNAWASLTAQSQLGGDPQRATAAHLAARGIRAILLYGIGRFASRGRDTTGTAATETDVPAGAEIIGGEAPGPFTWLRRARPPHDPYAHPEWAAAVWSSNRAALLSANDKETGTPTGALHLPEGAHLVAVRTDSLWTTADPGFPYRGEVGQWRVKGHLTGPLTAPATETELLALRPLARAEQAERETP